MGIQKARNSGKGPGRRPTEVKKLLRTFNPLGKTKEVKKEYIRVFVIRSFKRALRDVLDGRDPRKSAYAQCEDTKHYWEIFNGVALQYRDEVSAFAPAKTNPDTKNEKGKKKVGPRSFNDEIVKQMYQSRHILMLHYLFIHIVFGESLLPVPMLIQRLKIDCCGPAWDRNSFSDEDCTSPHAHVSPKDTDFQQTTQDARVEMANCYSTRESESTEESISEAESSHTGCHVRWAKLKDFLMTGMFKELKMEIPIQPPTASLLNSTIGRTQLVATLVGMLGPWQASAAAANSTSEDDSSDAEMPDARESMLYSDTELHSVEALPSSAQPFIQLSEEERLEAEAFSMLNLSPYPESFCSLP